MHGRLPVNPIRLQTAKALYILVTNANNGVTETVVDRKIALVTIKSISMTNLRDDWMVSMLPLLTHKLGSFPIPGIQPWTY